MEYKMLVIEIVGVLAVIVSFFKLNELIQTLAELKTEFKVMLEVVKTELEMIRKRVEEIERRVDADETALARVEERTTRDQR